MRLPSPDSSLVTDAPAQPTLSVRPRATAGEGRRPGRKALKNNFHGNYKRIYCTLSECVTSQFIECVIGYVYDIAAWQLCSHHSASQVMSTRAELLRAERFPALLGSS